MSLAETALYEKLKMSTQLFHPVLSFDREKDKMVRFDFTEKNKELQDVNFDDTEGFCKYVRNLLQKAGAKFGFGGYNELRTFYKRSNIFNGDLRNTTGLPPEEPRRLHLGIDIWSDDGTEVFAPWEGIIHSFAFNDNFGDYGATIILQHRLENFSFFTLYGHLSLQDLQNIREQQRIEYGQKFAHFGKPGENGHWPPHLHFQVIKNISSYKGDYPGVCKFSERSHYLSNCPDANLILNLQQW